MRGPDLNDSNFSHFLKFASKFAPFRGVQRARTMERARRKNFFSNAKGSVMANLASRVIQLRPLMSAVDTNERALAVYYARTRCTRALFRDKAGRFRNARPCPEITPTGNCPANSLAFPGQLDTDQRWIIFPPFRLRRWNLSQEINFRDSGADRRVKKSHFRCVLDSSRSRVRVPVSEVLFRAVFFRIKIFHHIFMENCSFCVLLDGKFP